MATLHAPIEAQQAPPTQNATERRVNVDVPSQKVSTALVALSRQTGIQFVMSSLGESADVQSQAVRGEMSLSAALEELLRGSGLTYRFSADSENTVTIEKAPNGERARVLGPVRVEGASTAAVNGVNGSTDVTATEGTGSYTSGALSIASKLPMSMKDTPQSVSVITQQRMNDQNLTDLESVMEQATGITLVTSGSLNPTYYSRGFQVTSFQIDGGAPLSITVGNGQYLSPAFYFPLIDMAMYDHVEILRGATGDLNGYGNPGATVSLSRKRPLDHAKVSVEGLAGSWNTTRVMLDATAPLGFDGRLRGRAVLSYQDNDFFFDTASNNQTLAYAILETDIGPTTLLSAGLNVTKQDAVPWSGGLPRYATGDDLNLPRDTCLCFPWNRWNLETKDVFLQLRQALGKDWSVNLNLTRTDQASDRKTGWVIGTVMPATGEGPLMTGGMGAFSSVQSLAEITAQGSFEVFGLRQELVVGVNYQYVDSSGYRGYSDLIPWNYVSPTGETGAPPVDVFNFDPSAGAYGEPRSSPNSIYYPDYGQSQWGAYASMRLTLLKPLHLITGLRYSHFNYKYDVEGLCTAHFPPTCNAIGDVNYEADGETYSGHDFSWPPRYSLVYDVTNRISVYGSYADIYNSQSDYLDVSGKPIDPISGSTFEAGIKWEAAGGRLNGSLAAYRTEQKDFAKFVTYGPYPDGTVGKGISCCYVNGDRVNFSRGADLEVTGLLRDGWQIAAGYTFNINQQRGSDVYPPDYNGPKRPMVSHSPKHLLKLWTSYQFRGNEVLSRLSVSAGVNAQTRSFNSGSACVEFDYRFDDVGRPIPYCADDVDYQYTQGFYSVFSTRLAYRINPNWNAALNVTNIADKRYYATMGSSDSGNVYGEPRSFMLTVRGQF